MRSVSPEVAARAYRAGALFVDVRASAQHARDGLPESLSVPLEAIRSGTLPAGLHLDVPIYLLCDRGLVSELAGLYLEQAGFTVVANVAGGLRALRGLL